LLLFLKNKNKKCKVRTDYKLLNLSLEVSVSP